MHPQILDSEHGMACGEIYYTCQSSKVCSTPSIAVDEPKTTLWAALRLRLAASPSLLASTEDDLSLMDVI